MFGTIFNFIFGKQNNPSTLESKLLKITSYDDNELFKQNDMYVVNSGQPYKIIIGNIPRIENLSVKNIILINYVIDQNNLVITVMPYFFENDDNNKFTFVNSDKATINLNNQILNLSFTNLQTREEKQRYNLMAKKLYYLQMNIESLKLQLNDENNKEYLDEIMKRLQYFEQSFKNINIIPLDIPYIVDENND